MSTISPTSISAAVLPVTKVPHLLLPFAYCADASWLATLKALTAAQTRHFAKLLQGMQLLHTDSCDALSMSPPHERALAQLHGLTGEKLLDGLIPWAAWEREHSEPSNDTRARHWAYVTPCHWLMGHEQATLTDPNDLALSEADSRALMAAMQVYFDADGIRLHYLAPQRWLADGEVFKNLPTASLDRVLGRSVNPWLPAGSSGKTLRRLQNEMQMLLYTHPINDVRSSQRQLPVNSIWFSGTGDLPEQHTPDQQLLSAPRTLADAVLRDDWQAYAAAWGALDAVEAKELLTRQSAGEVVRLTLCGERTAKTFESAPRSLLLRVKQLLKPKPLLGLLETL
ncbi:MAG: hypothetical protein RLZZ296_160 [Pseudomonadota bacterium]|jgi:hypothetical protein